MGATEYQQMVRGVLERYFPDVRAEWSVVTDATDAMSRDVKRYAPRVDVAVGPFNVTPGRDTGSARCSTKKSGAGRRRS